VLVAVSALALSHWSDGPELAAADYAQYIAHARALTEGRPYTDTGYIFTPLLPWAGPAAQPPGLPLVLALIFKTIGDSAAAVKVAMLASTLGFYALVGIYFARLTDAKFAAAIVLLLGVSNDLVRSATLVQSDLLFACLIWSVFLLYDRDGPFTPWRLVAITVLGAFSVATRTLGVALVPAVLLFTLLHWRQHSFKPAIPVAIWGGGFLLANTLLPITAGFPDVRAILQGIVPTAMDHIVAYRYALFDATLYPFPWNRANDVYHVVAILTMLYGLLTWVPQAFRRFSFVFAAVYVTMLIVVPVLAPRYLWPVYPLLVFGLLRGVSLIVGLFKTAPVQARGGVALATAVIIALLNVTWAERLSARETPLAARADVQDLFHALTRIAAREPIRVAFVRPQVLSLETRIPSMTTFEAPPQVVADELDRRCITHVVLGDLGLAPAANAAFRELVRVQPEGFELEYRNSTFEVHRFTALACRKDSGNAWHHQT
jgi:hypothetical protein